MVLSILNLYLPLIFVSLAFLCFANSKKKKKKKLGMAKVLVKLSPVLVIPQIAIVGLSFKPASIHENCLFGEDKNVFQLIFMNPNILENLCVKLLSEAIAISL